MEAQHITQQNILQHKVHVIMRTVMILILTLDIIMMIHMILSVMNIVLMKQILM